MLYNPGANHAPHQAPQEYIAKYKGKFDDGYEAYRTWVLARMIEKGVAAEGHTAHPDQPACQRTQANPADHVRPWNTLNADEKKLFSHMAEVYAGFSEYTDAQIGRVIDYLEKTGQLENTIVLYAADNGTSGEGTPNGSVNENKFFNGYPDDLAENMKLLDKLGGTRHLRPFPHRMGCRVLDPVPDVQALLAILRRYRRSAGHLVAEGHQGARRNPRPVPPFGRHRADHPRVVGLEMPKVYRGVEQFPLSGVSMRYTFDAAPHAPTQKKRQFYSMLGTRGMWEDGWLAAAVHAPFTGKGHFDQDQWELYHVDADRSESTDLANQYPEKLEALKKAWDEEARANLALPIDDRSASGHPCRRAPLGGTARVTATSIIQIRRRCRKALPSTCAIARTRSSPMSRSRMRMPSA